MNNRRIITGLFAFTVFVSAVGVWKSQFGNPRTGEISKTEHTDRKSQYTCPMHPQILRDQAGECPICGMDLVPIQDDQSSGANEGSKASPTQNMSGKPSDEPSGHAPVRLKLNRQQMIGIKLEPAEKKRLFKTIRAPGRIAFDPELYTAQSEYLEALKQWTQVKSSPLSGVKESTREMIKSARIRLKVLGLSEQQISRLAQKGTQSEGLLVSGKNQENWVYADIFEVDLPKVRAGLSAKISAGFLGGKTLPGKVISVDQVIDRKTRTAKARIQLLDRAIAIRPETYVSVEILAPLGEYVSVPLEALMDTGKETFVFVKGVDEIAPRRVVVGYETDVRVAVVKGLEKGEQVVIGGNFMLDSESRLRAVVRDSRASRSGSSGGHQH